LTTNIVISWKRLPLFVNRCFFLIEQVFLNLEKKMFPTINTGTGMILQPGSVLDLPHKKSLNTNVFLSQNLNYQFILV